MSDILFNNQVRVSVTKTPTNPIEGDTVVFTATPSIVLPDEKYSSLENYYFSYLWMVSYDGGNNYIAIGEENNPVLTINNVANDFNTHTYKVKITVEDLDGFILTESGDKLVTQMGEIIVGVESSSQIQTNYSNNTIFSDDLPLNLDTNISRLPVTDMVGLVENLARYDETITDDTIGEILSAQSPLIDSTIQQTISGPTKSQIDQPASPDPIITIIDDEYVDEQSLVGVQALYNSCYSMTRKSAGGGDVTISWRECKYESWSFSDCGSGKYNNLAACIQDGNCSSSDQCDNTVSTIATIDNIWWKDDSGNVNHKYCESLANSSCPQGKITGNQNCNENVSSLDRNSRDGLGTIVDRINQNRTLPTPQDGCATEKATGRDPVATICPYHDQDHDIDAPNIQESMGGVFPCCGGTMIATTEGDMNTVSPHCRNFFGFGNRGMVGFIRCEYQYYLKAWDCDGQKITLHSDDYLSDTGQSRRSADPVDLSGSIGGISYNCDGGGSLSVTYVEGKLLAVNKCCPYGTTCNCTPNGIPQFDGRPIVTLNPIAIQGRDNSPTAHYSIDRSTFFKDCVNANGACGEECSGKACCPVKTKWKLYNIGPKTVQCNRRIEIEDSNPPREFIAEHNLVYKNPACDRTSNMEFEVGRHRLVEIFDDGGAPDRNSSNDSGVLLERLRSYYDSTKGPYVLFVYKMQRSEDRTETWSYISVDLLGRDSNTADAQLKKRYKYSGSVNGYNFCGDGNCGVWYKVKGPTQQSYPCDDLHEEICGVQHPGACLVANCDHTNNILIFKIARISDSDECRRAKTEYASNPDSSNYAPTLAIAIQKARTRLGFTPGMICPEESEIPDPPNDPDVDSADDSRPADDPSNSNADSNTVSALSNFTRNSNNSVIENSNSIPSVLSVTENNISGSPGSFTINNITISRDNDGNITTQPDNQPSVPVYHDGQHSYDQYGNAWYLPPPASANRELIRATSVPSLSMSELYSKVQDS